MFIHGVGYLPNRYNDVSDETRLLYVAMTRAMEQLWLTCDRNSASVERLKETLGRRIDVLGEMSSTP